MSNSAMSFKSRDTTVLIAVRLVAEMRDQSAHHPPHVLWASCAQLFYGRSGDGLDLVLGHLLGKVLEDDVKLGLLFVHEVLAAPILEGGDAVPALLGLSHQDRGDPLIVEGGLAIFLLALNGRSQQPEHGPSRGIAGPHGLLEVFG